jgi:hypothetical protein
MRGESGVVVFEETGKMGGDGKVGATRGRETWTVSIGAPSLTVHTNLGDQYRFPARWMGARMGELTHEINHRRHAPVRSAFMICFGFFRSDPNARTLPTWAMEIKLLKILRERVRQDDNVKPAKRQDYTAKS